MLVDITCDSDGKIDRFIDLEDVRGTLALHPLEPNKPYYLGVFLVGAYQDIMGDLHNLFGRVNEVHVFLEDDEEDGFYIEESINGFKVDYVLRMIQWDGEELSRRGERLVLAAGAHSFAWGLATPSSFITAAGGRRFSNR